jgi:hypothetical protein
VCSLEEQEEYETHIQKWTRKEEKDLPFSIQFERSQAKSADIGFAQWIGGGGKRDKATLVTLQGASGRRVKIRRPEAFLEEVFKQPGLEAWVRTHYSVTYRAKYGGRGEWKAPELWLVTGVQYVTGGEFHFEGSTSKDTSAHLGADIGAAAGGPPGILRANMEGSHERSNGAQNDFGHEDERVWAAQFMPVKIEFGDLKDAELSTAGRVYPKTIARFRLMDVPDLTLQGFRVSHQTSEEPNIQPPELVGRITVETTDSRDEEETDDDDDDDDGGLMIDDGPYVGAMKDTNWEMYEKGLEYLWTAQKN